MNYRVDTADQLRTVLRALRKTQGLNQTELGKLIGVSQRRVASIEKTPGVTAFDQIARLVLVLGGRLTVEVPGIEALAEAPTPTPYDARPKRRVKSRAQKAAESGNW
jgi:HTH-type transcriptional regulator / antitoxin HipB